eukprot:3399956-Rhodomonas_salina.1
MSSTDGACDGGGAAEAEGGGAESAGRAGRRRAGHVDGGDGQGRAAVAAGGPGLSSVIRERAC